MFYPIPRGDRFDLWLVGAVFAVLAAATTALVLVR